MSFSIVITTYNRRDVVTELIEHLAGQSDPDFEVVVAIDGSTDGTAERLAELKPPFPLRWVDTHCTGYGLAVARNAGILAARGEIVAIIDDDSIPAPGYVAAHCASVAAGVITGGPRNPSDPQSAPRMAWKMAELAKLPPLMPMKLDAIRREYPNVYLIENNICMLREDWVRLGLFSERLKLYGFIGQEFFARAEYLGFEYQYNPAASVTHHAEREGDNSFTRRRKNRQVQIASLIRPSLMTPRHFLAQTSWAKAAADRAPLPRLPRFALHAAAAMPLHIMRQLASAARRRLRAMAK